MEDQRSETLTHIKQVASFINKIVLNLNIRAFDHDQSKLESPEREIFDEYTPRLRDTTYGSDKYNGYLKEMKVALDHHYKQNRHHPEHHENGVKDMNLIDLIEMLCDWKAATMRHADGDIMKSIEHNQKRFGYSNELASIFKNTIRDLGWE